MFLTDFFKSILKWKFIKKPWVLILIVLVLHWILGDGARNIGYYLKFHSDKTYEDLVWNYKGLTDFGKLTLINRGSLANVEYLQSYCIRLLMILVPTVILFSVAHKIEFIFAPGKVQDTYRKWANFLATPSKLVFWIAIITCVLVFNNFLRSVHSSYVLGVNDRLVKELNEYSVSRTRYFFSEKNKQKSMSTNIFCSFQVHSKPHVYKLSYLDFLFCLVLGEEPKGKKLEKIIKNLPPSLEMRPDNETINSYDLELKKNAYSKEEVKIILENDRKNRVLRSMSSVAKSREYFQISYYNNEYEVFLNSGEDVFLGTVDLVCSNNSREHDEFLIRSTLNWDFDRH